MRYFGRRRMKRFCILLLVVLAAMSLAVSVSANSAPDSELGEVVYSPISIVLVVLVLAGSILLALGKTLASEWLVAWLFRFDQSERRMVLLTNLVSQGTMWAAMILTLLLGGVPVANFFMKYYVEWIVVLELLIYTFEFLWYRKKFFWYSGWRCLAFSIVANTASLALGFVRYWNLFH